MTAPYTGFPGTPGGLPGGTTSPVSSMPGLPMGSSSMPFNSAQQLAIENAVHSNPDLAGIWDTIKNAGGDVWGTVEKILPKGPDGSIDWGKVGSNVFGFIKDNAPAIFSGLSAINSYQRQGKADQYGQAAVAAAQKSYDERAPLRMAGQAGMLDPHKGTPDLSALSAQGQQGKSIQAPLPMAAPQTAYQNAASVAGNNPFTKGLPMAPAPVSGTPNVPGGPAGPASPGPSAPHPFTPPVPAPSGPGNVQFAPQSGPIANGPQNRPLPTFPTAPPLTAVAPPPPVPGALQLAPQSGPIAAGPKNRTLPTFPTGFPQYGIQPLPLAGG